MNAISDHHPVMSSRDCADRNTPREHARQAKTAMRQCLRARSRPVTPLYDTCLAGSRPQPSQPCGERTVSWEYAEALGCVTLCSCTQGFRLSSAYPGSICKPRLWNECRVQNRNPVADVTKMIEQTSSPPQPGSANLGAVENPRFRGDLAIVQFPHPREEQRPDVGDWYNWNASKHGRKFMRSPGQWVAGPGPEADGGTSDIVFWGEWESVSRVVKRYPTGDSGMPRYLAEPRWTRPSSSGFLQNTDPFIFGGAFRYSNCRQNSPAGNPKAMQRLSIGSLILFGSSLGGRFVLDTAFVIGSRHPMSAATVADAVGSDAAFRAVVSDVLYRDKYLAHQNTLFRGATPADAVGDMFSFFPCLPAEAAPVGFARPAIELPGYINERSLQSERKTPVGSIDDVASAWRSVVDQVRDQGLALGVHAQTPAYAEADVVSANDGSC